MTYRGTGTHEVLSDVAPAIIGGALWNPSLVMGMGMGRPLLDPSKAIFTSKRHQGHGALTLTCRRSWVFSRVRHEGCVILGMLSPRRLHHSDILVLIMNHIQLHPRCNGHWGLIDAHM